MTFQRPTLPEILDRVQGDFSVRLPGADAKLRHSNLGVIAHVLSGLSHGLHGHLDWIAGQAIPDTATDEYLERWAAIFGVQRKIASLASGTVRITGADGTAIPAGTRLSRSDGAEFEVGDGGVVTAGQVDLEVTARVAGSDANTSIGSTLRLQVTIAGADSQGSAHSEIAGGADTESDAELRQRMLLRIQAPPQGGAAHDYMQWALEVPGVTRVWVSPGEIGLGTVSVRFMMDEVRAAFGGAPQGDSSPNPTGDLALVFDNIDAQRPVTAQISVVAPILTAIDITIADLEPDTPEVRQAITEELNAMLFHVSEPGGVVPISKIWEAVSLATGENSHRITSPVDDIDLPIGEIGVLGAITYA